MNEDLKFEDYRSSISIKEVLTDAGYVQMKRDGLRYPSFVRLDNQGRRIRGDKFIVTPNGNCCFHPPQIKVYSVTSLIWEHPEMFQESSQGLKGNELVNAVCRRLMNMPKIERYEIIGKPTDETRIFNVEDYDIQNFIENDRESQRSFYPYFKHRGINLGTQSAFKNNFVLATHDSKTEKGKSFKNLSFPIIIPGDEGRKWVGFEERGRMRKDGESPYKGKAYGSNGSEGLWIASPKGTALKDTKKVLLFESAYDAMAYYQLHNKLDKDLRSAVFVSTGGTPTVNQMTGIIRNAPQAAFHLCFDNDQAGRQFVDNFQNIISRERPDSVNAIRYRDTPGNIEADDDKEAAFDMLPEEVRRQYYKAYELAEEYATSFLCPEDRSVLKKEKNEAFAKFNRMVDELIVDVVIEQPKDGYKDWNEELLGELNMTERKTVGTDIDGDGMVETDEANEEKRHYHR